MVWRLALGLSAIFALFVLVGGLTLLTFTAQNRQFQSLVELNFPAVRLSSDLTRQAETIHATAMSLALARSPVALDAAADSLQDQLQLLNSIAEQLRSYLLFPVDLNSIETSTARLKRSGDLLFTQLQGRLHLDRTITARMAQLERLVKRAEQQLDSFNQAQQEPHPLSYLLQKIIATSYSAYTLGDRPGARKKHQRILTTLVDQLRAIKNPPASLDEALQFLVSEINQEPTLIELLGIQSDYKRKIHGLLREIRELSLRIAEISHHLHGQSQERLQRTVDEQKREIAIHQSLIAFLTLLASLVMLALVLHLKRRVLRRFDRLHHTMTLQMQGTKQEIVVDGGDEITAMSESFKLFVAKTEQAEASLAKALERAEEASRAKSLFLATMSHEIRTPLNGIIGMVARLTSRSLPTEEERMVEVISQASDGLLHTLNNVLDFSKIEAGQLELEEIIFNPSQLLSGIITGMQGNVGDRPVLLHGTVHNPEEMVLRGDSVRISQIVNNLLSNALKFTAKGEVKLEAQVEDIDGVRAMLTITVMDTGIGVDPDRIQRLFEPFRQMDESITRRFGGTGLGLAISYGLARAMGGAFSAAARQEGGSLFTLELALPIHEIGGVNQRPQTVDENLPQPADSLKILLVEDDPINREVGEGLLSDAGHQVMLAEDGYVALKLTPAISFDLILMDLRMPGLDGLETTRRIRQQEREEGRCATAIVALTADVLKETLEQCMDAGMDEVLTKPVHIERLHQVLQQIHAHPDATVVQQPQPVESPSRAEPLAQASEPEVLNIGFLEGSFLTLDVTIQQKILQQFNEASKQNLDKFTAAMMDGQQDEMVKLAHTLSGSCRSVGLNRVASHTHQLQVACEAEQAEQVDALYRALPNLLEQDWLALQSWLSNQHA
uniref:histidine kinase n=1 Tax=Magnetococcus massalia (strain MO-1) TaxID=451514 RepID=A0A1S7LPB8_MAGMO|nr:Putative sensor histidine kinase with a response regulator receiver domain [Candidatus Magnetococcus massalia]